MNYLDKSSGFQWDTPIWIIGNPRSGTSLFRIMLDTHPEIGIPPESHFFLWLEAEFGDFGPQSDLSPFLDGLYKSTKFETWELDRDELRQHLEHNQPGNYAQLIALIYLAYSIQNGKHPKFWGDKNKLWKEKLPVVKKYYPDSKMIHIIRDGRDVACSFRSLHGKKMDSRYAPKLPYEIEKIAERWKQNIRAITEFARTQDKRDFLTIRYEDLLREPERLVRQACEFLGIEFLPQQVRYYQRAAAEIEPAEFFQWKEKLTAPPDLANAGKYKKELKPEEIHLFNEICREELTLFGYL